MLIRLFALKGLSSTTDLNSKNSMTSRRFSSFLVSNRVATRPIAEPVSATYTRPVLSTSSSILRAVFFNMVSTVSPVLTIRGVGLRLWGSKTTHSRSSGALKLYWSEKECCCYGYPKNSEPAKAIPKMIRKAGPFILN